VRPRTNSNTTITTTHYALTSTTTTTIIMLSFILLLLPHGPFVSTLPAGILWGQDTARTAIQGSAM
jgi:hypothetical protein